jgi:hypothetical protein
MQTRICAECNGIGSPNALGANRQIGARSDGMRDERAKYRAKIRAIKSYKSVLSWFKGQNMIIRYLLHHEQGTQSRLLTVKQLGER